MLITEEEVVQLATSEQAANDEESSDDEQTASDTTMVSHADTVHAFDTYIQYLEQQSHVNIVQLYKSTKRVSSLQ